MTVFRLRPTAQSCVTVTRGMHCYPESKYLSLDVETTSTTLIPNASNWKSELESQNLTLEVSIIPAILVPVINCHFF